MVIDPSRQAPIDDLVRGHIVFISHSAADLDFINREIVPLLRAIPLDFHLENRHTRRDPGTSALYEQYITRSLHRCPQFLLVLSPASVASVWVAYEVRQALAMERRIVPIMIQDCDPRILNPELERFGPIDFRRASPWAKRRLRRRLEPGGWLAG